MIVSLRWLFITLAFLVVSKTSYTQELLPDSVENQIIDSLSLELNNQDSSEQSVLFKSLNLIQVKFSLDSLTEIAKVINNSLDNNSSLNKDSLIHYQLQLRGAQEKANDIGKLIKEDQNIQIDTLGLGDQAIIIYCKLGTLKGRVEERIRKVENQVIKEKAGYIWTAPLGLEVNNIYDAFRSSFRDINSGSETTTPGKGGSFLLLLISLGYFYWLFKNRRTALVPPRYSFPIAESLLFFLVLFPIFDRSINIRYIELIQLLTLLIVCWRFRNYIEIQSPRWWFGLITLFILSLLFNYMIMSNGLIIRSIAIGLNLLALNIGFITVNRLKSIIIYTRTYRILFSIYLVLNLLAIGFNVVGQVNISKITSITAIVGAIQLIGLVALGKIISENLSKQLAKTKKSESFLANLNEIKVASFIRKAMFIIGSILWVTVFMINLEIINTISEFSRALLNKPHKFGSVTFTLGNLIYCIIIISIANWLQKNLDTLLSDNRSTTFGPQSNQKGTKITLLRLAIIILGFLLGVTALGISMNKLTVILGALSVGIGLGMQNIFNNFVSGVILIFEKPFKIGDFIELADKKGRVQKIGIRSSTLLTEQGSEVIIPNGDLLSGRLVNWTHSHSYYRSELIFKFNATSNLEEVKQVILTAIDENKFSIKEGSAEILYKSISTADFELVVRCWIMDIYKEPQFKSELLQELSKKLSNAEIVSLQ